MIVIVNQFQYARASLRSLVGEWMREEKDKMTNDNDRHARRQQNQQPINNVQANRVAV